MKSLDKDATFRTHIENIAAKARSRTWTLAKLRKKGLSQTDLLRTYKSLIRPAMEYAAPVWHSLINAGQAATLEKQQAQALKNIFGPGSSAAKMRKRAGIEMLSTRREELVVKFAKKNQKNPRCQDWFVSRGQPIYARRKNTSYPIFQERSARTDRHRNTPKNYLVRKLNEHS